MAAIAKTNGINFLPLYSPKRPLISRDAVVEFTDEEMKHFKRRFDEGYDVPGDHDTCRYIQWLKIHHPECNIPHRINPSSITATGCHGMNSITVNHPTNSLPGSSKELTVQGNCAEGISTQTGLVLTKRSKLHSFLKYPLH